MLDRDKATQRFIVRVLILHNRYRQPGGEDVVAQSQAELLRSKGHEVRLFEKDNKVIDSYGLFRKALLFFETADNARSAAEVEKIVAEFKPDVAHIHNTLPLLSPSIYKPLKRAGVKVIQYLHNYRLVCPAGTLFRDGKHCQLCVDGTLAPAVEYRCWSQSKMATLAVTRMLERHRRAKTWHRDVDLFVALNGYMRDVFVDKGVVPAEKIVVQGNLSAAVSVHAIVPGEGFIFVGRLVPEKGLRDFMFAALRLSCEGPTAIAIAGEGPLSEEEALFGPRGDYLADENGHEVTMPFNGTVDWLGQIGQRAVIDRIAASRALVFPSVWQEPFGLSIIEAMALSKPVIASRVAGPKDIVQEGVTGLLFEPGNVDELAACMKRLQENPDLAVQLGQAGRAWYEQEYSPEAGYRRMEENWQRLGLM